MFCMYVCVYVCWMIDTYSMTGWLWEEAKQRERFADEGMLRERKKGHASMHTSDDERM